MHLRWRRNHINKLKAIYTHGNWWGKAPNRLFLCTVSMSHRKDIDKLNKSHMCMCGKWWGTTGYIVLRMCSHSGITCYTLKPEKWWWCNSLLDSISVEVQNTIASMRIRYMCMRGKWWANNWLDCFYVQYVSKIHLKDINELIKIRMCMHKSQHQLVNFYTLSVLDYKTHL